MRLRRDIVLAFLVACGNGGDDAPDFIVEDAAPRDGGGGRIDGDPTFVDGDVNCTNANERNCNGACVDVKLDVANCGSCGHDCLGGSCGDGVCKSLDMASGLDIPQGIVATHDALWVTVYAENKVIRLDKDKPGTPTTVSTATTFPWGIAAQVDSNGDAVRLVWGENRGTQSHVLVCTLPGCTSPTTVAASDDVKYIRIDGTTAYWTENSSSAGKVRKCNVTDCANTAVDVITNEPYAYGLAIGSGALFFSRRDTTGVVRRAALGSATATDFMTGIADPVGIAVDDTNLYVAVSSGTSRIATCPLVGTCTATTFSEETNPHEVWADGTNVYWNKGLASGGAMMWCPKSGCGGAARTLAATESNPFSIATDDKAIYWTNSTPGGQVVKIAKP